MGYGERVQNKKAGSTSGTQKTLLSRFLDDAGDGTGAMVANGDYSSAEEIFFIQPPAATRFRIARLMVEIEDIGSVTGGKYGALSALTNGIQVRTQNDSGTLVDLTNSLPVKTNANWGRFSYDVFNTNFGGGANDYVQARWSFIRFGQHIRLDGDANDRLEIVLNDDLSGLVSHTFMAQGFIE